MRFLRNISSSYRFSRFSANPWYNTGMKILVVEDERKIADSIKKGLEQERWSVDLAGDGQKGYDMAVSEEYDVIIMDRMLPILEGVEVIRMLRQKNVTIPVLVLTAKGELGDKIEGFGGGADDYLVKPFAFEELVARVKALARRPKKTTSDILVCNTLTMDTKVFEVTRDGNEIDLTGKEYAVLVYLMENKDHVVTKEQIIRAVWDFDSNVLPNTVEAYIKNIREKIDEDYSPKLIHTVRGFGYKVTDKKYV